MGIVWRTLLPAFLLLAPSQAQDKLAPLFRALQRSDLTQALTLLEKGPKPKGETALEAARRFFALATSPGRSREQAKLGLKGALKILQGAIPSSLKHEKIDLSFRTALELGKVILEGRPASHSPEELAALEALQAAHMYALGMEGERKREALKEVDLLLLPLCRKLRHTMEVVRYARELLELPISPGERRRTRDALGEALLALNRPKEAFTYLQDKIRENPSDPNLIYPLAKGLFRSSAQKSLDLLFPVIGKDPARKDRKTWTQCLDLFYKAFRAIPKRKDPGLSLVKQHRVLIPLPRMWGHASWAPGFRAYRKEGTRPGKVYGGKLRIQVMIPFSKGWVPSRRPPGDLVRWRNTAIALRRGGKGPAIVLYWFGPDLFYWYGTTPRRSGVTGKGSRGDSKGGIASLVSKLCYGPGARKRGLRFKPVTPLPYSLGVQSGVTKRAWIRARTIYQEYFFSAGQVTLEVLLKIRKEDAQLLGPELRWCLRNIRLVKK